MGGGVDGAVGTSEEEDDDEEEEEAAEDDDGTTTTTLALVERSTHSALWSGFDH